MSTSLSLPTYQETANALASMEAEFHPSQIHGLICGFICGTSGKANIPWQKMIGGNKKNQEAVNLFERLYEFSYQQMSEFSFEFSLLLPEDDTAIGTRTEALGLWCQGFITGLNQTSVNLDNISDEAIETLEDITEIAQVNFEEMTENEEDETAYFELIEYARLAALMMYNELNISNASSQDEAKQEENIRGSNLLH